MRWIAFMFFCLYGCQSVPTEVKPVTPKKNIQAEPSLPTKPLSLDFLDPKEEMGCPQFQKITMLSCLYPDQQEVPFPYCEKDDSYAIQGMIPFALCTSDVDILVAHLAYAKQKYRPSTIGLIERTISRMLGGIAARSRPMTYTKGLKGQSALNMMTAIYIDGRLNGIYSQPMKDIISEQANREPTCPFYQFLRDSVDKDFTRSIKLSMDPKSKCSYHNHYDAALIKLENYYVQDLIRKALK